PVGVAMFGLGRCSLPHVVVEPFDGIADDAVLFELVEYLMVEALSMVFCSHHEHPSTKRCAWNI
ncbi:hypothetical protein, partial [Eggerthella lenta]|uniref:hypothetical protein n=1 Tax=Eggerthella lenta TaxID=84112 RepID=UPI001C695DC6